MPADSVQVASRLYQAFAAHDRDALLATLAGSFRGRVTDGMPNGLGGTYEGADAMLHDCWARVFAAVDVRPIAEEYLPVAEDRIVVLGRYVGTARETGRPLSAAFAHVLRIEGGRVSELVQITDTVRWQQALELAPDPTRLCGQEGGSACG
jgi:ketosteroid isomerase-like protein